MLDPEHNEKQQQEAVEHEEDQGELPDVLYANVRVGVQVRNLVVVPADIIVRMRAQGVAKLVVSNVAQSHVHQAALGNVGDLSVQDLQQHLMHLEY